MLRLVDGIVFRSFPMGESDLVIVLYTRELGKVRAIVKGALRNQSNMRAVSQQFVYGRFQLDVKVQGLSIARQAEISEVFGTVRTNIEAMACASYFVEVVDALTPDFHKDEAVFLELLCYMYHISVALSEEIYAVQVCHMLRLMKHLGHAFMLERCVVCGKEESLGGRVSPCYGGALCSRCDVDDAVEITHSEWHQLKYCNTYTIDSSLDAILPLRSQIACVVDSTVFALLEKRPKSFEFYSMMRGY